MPQLLHLDCPLPTARIDRALDVLNAPGSTRQEFQSFFNLSNLGPGDLEELSPELWEELRLNGAEAEYDLYMRDLESIPKLSEAAGISIAREEIPIADVPRTTLSGLETVSPSLHRDIVIELQAVRNRDPRKSQSPHSCQSLRLMTHLNLEDQEMSLKHRQCQGLPRVRDRHQDHLAVLVDLKMCWM